MINKEDFINANLVEFSPRLVDLGASFGISIDEVRKLKETYSRDLKEIQKIRDIFRAKQKTKDGDKSLFKFKSFKDFHDWYIEQERFCYYCGTKEEVLVKIFEKGILESKRGSKRGKSLEIERRNAKGNEYSRDNCVLACYFCNNHKSDIISEEDHRKYFSDKIAEYLRAKAAELE